ncbi:SRPBCC family protein [Actinoplanes sp. NPDC051851]|uniref:SRPBCC family protein n=1 Tax=Actinoplanes sp. NPDC051851 TaxID=3154753 RepID=UPI0034139350
MATESRHVSEHIDRPAADVYAYVRNPANLAHWAHGVGSSLTEIDHRWYVQTPDGGGRAEVVFAPENAFGVLDHHVHLPGGDVVYMPVRVLADGTTSEIVFTVRRMPGMTGPEFDRDAAAVAADLALLKRILER